jgi:alpha-D-ribose 1-methylphosphonate 5-triphosphate diphosphatase
MSDETVLTNARMVLPDRVITGTLQMRDGTIASLSEEKLSDKKAVDLEGDYLLPGLVDLHTDSLRKGVMWNPVSAAIAHDATVIAAGVTTVFDALCVGDSVTRPAQNENLNQMMQGLDIACGRGLLRADHKIHLRCEVTDPAVADLVEERIDDPLVGLISVMDHAPGHRQMKEIDYYRNAWLIGTRGMTPEEADREIDLLIERSRTVAPEMRRKVSEMAHARGKVVASHDDETLAHVEEALGLGIEIAEFPTTEDAARAAHQNGMAVLMGGPNLVRGGSHFGNVATGELARLGLLDALMSDYIMSSMLAGVFRLTRDDFDFDLPAAVALAASNPARVAGLDDRGQIAEKQRADLIRVRIVDDLPVVVAVWCAGRKVF